MLEAETRPVPTHLGDEQAAGFVIGFRTAHAALVERCAIESGDTLVVLGAAGNSGASAAQLGKALGATVIVVASNQHKLAYCTAIGADHVVNYTVDNGCLRTLTGAQQFCAIRSYLSTAAKHGKHFFDTLVMLTEGHPWLPATN